MLPGVLIVRIVLVVLRAVLTVVPTAPRRVPARPLAALARTATPHRVVPHPATPHPEALPPEAPHPEAPRRVTHPRVTLPRATGHRETRLRAVAGAPMPPPPASAQNAQNARSANARGAPGVRPRIVLRALPVDLRARPVDPGTRRTGPGRAVPRGPAPAAPEPQGLGRVHRGAGRQDQGVAVPSRKGRRGLVVTGVRRLGGGKVSVPVALPVAPAAAVRPMRSRARATRPGRSAPVRGFRPT